MNSHLDPFLILDHLFGVVDEVENEADQLQSQGEGPTAMQTDQGQTGVGGQGEVTDSLSVPGDKRMMTSPIEGSLPKKRPR